MFLSERITLAVEAVQWNEMSIAEACHNYAVSEQDVNAQLTFINPSNDADDREYASGLFQGAPV